MRSGDKKLTVYVYREWNAIYESLNFQYLYSIILQVLIYQLYYTTCGIKTGRSRNGKQDEHSVMKIYVKVCILLIVIAHLMRTRQQWNSA